jgi:hypothetical protein
MGAAGWASLVVLDLNRGAPPGAPHCRRHLLVGVGERQAGTHPRSATPPGTGLQSRSRQGRWRQEFDDLRPSLSHPIVTELGHRLGSARGVDCYASVEDSVVLLGPPRSVFPS